jgi:hypothetical protein
MPGGVMQLVGKGAQDQLVTGSPSFSHFRSMYKRHTDFAMEHFRLYFKTTNLSMPAAGSLTLKTRVERFAQLINDSYLSITLPNIYSPVVAVTPPANGRINNQSNAIGYEFQWIENIGYNMINYVSLTINGQEIVRHTGEWMKLYAALKYNQNKKALNNELVGNVAELNDPANAFDRINQYPHSISSSTKTAEPSIHGRVLTIPFHFWFCENVGTALPLVALQQSDVEIVVELKNMYSLFTVLDTNPNSTTFGSRIVPSNTLPMSTFLSPPTRTGVPVNSSLQTWNIVPFIEANYIFLHESELAHIAKTDHSFIITQVDLVSTFGQYGPSNDLELMLRNLCTRVVWVCQRIDRAALNDYDNYTNWENRNIPPVSRSSPLYTSGNELASNISQRDILLESSIILDGNERFGIKQSEFFSRIQNYRHQDGVAITDLPGIYSYSFALDHDKGQPSGHLNGSMFNRTILRNTYVTPPLTTSLSVGNNVNGTFCVLKSTALNANPTFVRADNINKYSPDELVRIVRKTDAQTLAYSYNVRAYVESYNFLRVLGGIGNVVFSS